MISGIAHAPLQGRYCNFVNSQVEMRGLIGCYAFEQILLVGQAV